MTTIPTNRASYQPKPKIPFGQRRIAKKAALRVCNDVERGKINCCIELLNQCKVVSKEPTFKYNLSEVYRIIREITTDHV